MKKLLLLPLFCLLLFGCDKDTIEPTEDELKEFIVKEKWLVSSYNVFYYDKDGQLIREIDEISDWKYDFSDDSLRISSVKDDFSVTHAYSFSTKENKKIITLTHKSGSYSIYKVNQVADSEMVWEQDSQKDVGEIEYYDTTIGKTATRVVAKITIKKL